MDKFKIYLSASQQPFNMYADGVFTEEEVMHAYVHNYLFPALDRTGLYDIKCSDQKGDLYQNISEGNMHMGRHGLYLSHHTNAATTKNDGLLVLTSGSHKSNIAARIMYDELKNVNGNSDEGIRAQPTFAELYRTKSPALIIELFYHDNLLDMRQGILQLQQYAEAEVIAIGKIVEEFRKIG